MKDKYDEAIEYLTRNPDQICRAWDATWSHVAGCLFRPASASTTDPGRGIPWPLDRTGSFQCGCLTTIRLGEPGKYGHAVLAETEDLTKEIRADERIPKTIKEVTVEHLPVFAEWQRRLDKELNRK